MLAAERHRRIVELINTEQSVRVSELSKMFSVTEETIRRDILRLEAEGKVIRTHGGAVSLAFNDKPVEIPYFDREIARIEQKKAIAAKAIEMVSPGDRIALDASTTAWQMARLLPDLPLTVVTNSVNVVMELATKENIVVIAVGGELASRSLSFVGPLTERSIEHYYVQKAFLSCQGVDLQYGVSEVTEAQGHVKAKFIACSDIAILLVDSSKFGKRGFSRFCSVADIDTIITDDEIDDDMAQTLDTNLFKVATVERSPQCE